MSLEDRTTDIEWPNKSGIYKIVQVVIRDRPYLAFGSLGDLHANILRDFLTRRKISYDEVRNWERELVPALNGGEDYQVSGAGRVQVDVETCRAYFFGNSQGYKIGIDESHLERLREFTDWDVYDGEAPKE